jgi:predicted DNA-binding transcriptional regulator AlpA
MHMALTESVDRPMLCNVEEMCRILRVSTPTLHKLMAIGSAPPNIRVGKQIRFVLGAAFDAWARTQAQEQAQQRPAVAS